MDHKEFLSSLSQEAKAELTERSDAPGLWHLSGHVGAIILVGALIAVGVPGWQVLLPVQGVLLVFLFTLEHEATHKTPFASEALNEWVGRLCGVVIFLPFEWFRYFHLAHHRWTNIPGKDPELHDGGEPDGWWSYISYVSGLPYWFSMIAQVFRGALGRAAASYLPSKALPRIVREGRSMLVTYAVALASLLVTDVLLWVWLVPLLLGQPFLRLYLLAEHGRCPNVVNMFENTRTTFTTALVRFLAWNMPYHAEHHAYPQVPFYKLPELHERTAEHLAVTEAGYGRFTRGYVAGLGGAAESYLYRG